MLNYTQKARVTTFRSFSRKGWSVFASLHREVRIGVLGAATLGSAVPSLMSACPARIEAAESRTALAADTLALAEADVTVSREALAAAVAARPVITLRRADIAAAGVSSINDVLKLAAGVDVRQRGGFGIQTDISIHGGTHDQICILLNGVPLSNPQTGHNAADFPLNLSDIDRIEVLAGAAARVMGGQAFSGAINVVTRRPAARSVEAGLEAGGHALWRSEARLAGTWGRGWSATASGSYQRSDGAVRNGAFKGGKGYASMVCDTPLFLLTMQVGATANDFGANTFYSAAYPDQWEATRRYLVSARGESRGRLHLVPLLAWLRSTDHYQLTRHSTAGENFHLTDVFTASLQAWTDWRAGRSTFGAEIRDERILSTNLGYPLAETDYVPVRGESLRFYTRRAKRTNQSYFFEHRLEVGSVGVSAGVTAVCNPAMDNHFKFYPGIDLCYRPASHWRVFASYNQALRLPTFTDLWYKSAVQQGNEGLKPEESTEYVLGAEYNRPAYTLSVQGRYLRGHHIIDWVMRSPDDIYHATAFGLRNYGVDVETTLRLSQLWGAKQPFERLVLAYAYTGQQRCAGEDYYKSNYAFEYLRHKLTARLTHRVAPGLTAAWSLRVQQRQGAYAEYAAGKPTGVLQPYGTHALLDLRLDWTVKAYAFFLNLTNLTAHRYYDLANVRQPGLLVQGGVHWHL